MAHVMLCWTSSPANCIRLPDLHFVLYYDLALVNICCSHSTPGQLPVYTYMYEDIPKKLAACLSNCQIKICQ